MSALRKPIEPDPIPLCGGGGGGEPPSYAAVRRMAIRKPHLLPVDGSTRAFVAWLICNEMSGEEWSFIDLLDTYGQLCELAGRAPLSRQVFASGLKRLGLERRQMDLRSDETGERYRPTFYTIPAALGPET